MEINAHGIHLVMRLGSGEHSIISALESLSVVLNRSEIAVQLSLSWVMISHSGRLQCSSSALTFRQHGTASQSVTVCPFWLESVCQPFNPDRSHASLSLFRPVSLRGSSSDKVQRGDASSETTDAIFGDITLLKSSHLLPTIMRKEGKSERDGEDILDTLTIHILSLSLLPSLLLKHVNNNFSLNLQLTHNLPCSVSSHLHT